MIVSALNLTSPTFTTHYLEIFSFATQHKMSSGTGFIYLYEETFYLITNGHIVTGVNPEQTSRINSIGAFPGFIQTKARVRYNIHPQKIGISKSFTIDLYEDTLSDTDFKKPLWYIHPEKGYLIDVVAIPICKVSEIPEHVKFFPINKINFDKDEPLEVADDVFILGYPFNIKDKLELPIWKRGTIASEPVLSIDGLPKMYVDTATRSGMSGSPVIMRRTGIHGFNGETLTGKETFGTIHNFIGIYSGRIGVENEYKAQLGIIWKEEVILQILEKKVKSDISFQMVSSH